MAAWGLQSEEVSDAEQRLSERFDIVGIRGAGMRTTFEYSVNNGSRGLGKSSDRFFLVMHH